MRTLALLSLLLFAVEAQAYNPPIGIPAPAFGIDQPTYDAEAHCPNWPSAANSIAGGDYTSATDCFDNVYDRILVDDETINSNP